METVRCEVKEGRCWKVGRLSTGQREEVEIFGLNFEKLMLGSLHEKHQRAILEFGSPEHLVLDRGKP